MRYACRVRALAFGLASIWIASCGPAPVPSTDVGIGDAIVDSSATSRDVLPVDVNQPDAPRPIGPVVVGPNLDPASYGCLRGRPTPTSGAAMSVTLRVIDWADHAARAGYEVRVFPSATWVTTMSCAGYPGCTEGTSDAAGHVSLAIESGRAWIAVGAFGGGDPTHIAAAQWIAGLDVAAGATTLDVPVLSQRTASSIVMALGFGGPFGLGTVLDCTGAAVQRARVRVFAEGGTEVLTSPLGMGPEVLYGDGSGLPRGGSDRSAIDGVFVYFGVGTSATPALRIEAWGRLTLGANDVLLSCEHVSFVNGAAIVANLGPLASDAPPDCGSLP